MSLDISNAFFPSLHLSLVSMFNDYVQNHTVTKPIDVDKHNEQNYE
jgi:hypothetical protein